MPPVEGYPFVHRETARFRDTDAMGHVNNAVFLTYLEQARIAYLRSLGVLEGPLQLAMILARVEIDFRAQAWPGEQLEIGVRPARFGTKSFDLEYEVRSDGRVVAEAKTVLVGFDYVANASVELPAEWREALVA
jgi:acyl-CoA thioester hydrolase